MPVAIHKAEGGVITAWLDNAPRRNAMDDAMLAALSGLLEEHDQDSTARVIVIRGRGGFFCSGRDLGALAPDTAGADSTPASRLLPITRLAAAFRQCAIPVVALVEGKAAGLGVSLACWSDIAIAAAGASFSIPEARAGIAPSVTAVSLIEAVGRRWALDLCLTGRSVNASTALHCGLVQYVSPPDEAETTLQEVLGTLLKGAPQALRLTKDLGRRAESMGFEDALAAGIATAGLSLAGAELAEGLTALREKRPPAWQRNEAGPGIASPTTSPKEEA